jgi:hypothetical protein
VSEHVRSIWKTVAFLGRYGHQDMHSCLSLPLSDLCDLATAIGEMVRDEGEAMKVES